MSFELSNMLCCARFARKIPRPGNETALAGDDLGSGRKFRDEVPRDSTMAASLSAKSTGILDLDMRDVALDPRRSDARMPFDWMNK